MQNKDIPNAQTSNSCLFLLQVSSYYSGAMKYVVPFPESFISSLDSYARLPKSANLGLPSFLRIFWGLISQCAIFASCKNFMAKIISLNVSLILISSNYIFLSPHMKESTIFSN